MLKAAKQAASLGSEGKLIPDTDMAEQLASFRNSEADLVQPDGKSQKRSHDGKRVKSLREGRTKPHRHVKESNSVHKRKRKQVSK